MNKNGTQIPVNKVSALQSQQTHRAGSTTTPQFYPSTERNMITMMNRPPSNISNNSSQ